MFVTGCSSSRRLKSLKHSVSSVSKLERKDTHAITCLRSRLTQLASFKGGASGDSSGSSHNAKCRLQGDPESKEVRVAC